MGVVGEFLEVSCEGCGESFFVLDGAVAAMCSDCYYDACSDCYYDAVIEEEDAEEALLEEGPNCIVIGGGGF